MSRWVGFVGFALVASVITGCGEKRDKRERVDDDQAVRSGSARPSEPPPAEQDAAETWPIVEVSATEVHLGSELTDKTRELIDRNRLQRLDGLFAALKGRRDVFKQVNPGKPFPGVCGIRVEADVPQLVFKSVFQTAAFAGYPRLSVQLAGDRRIYDLSAQIPGPPDPTAEPKPPAKLFDVQLEKDEIQVRWRQGAEVLSEKTLRRDAKELSRVACEEWSTQGTHRDTADAALDEVIVHAPNDSLFKDVPDYLAALGDCKREYPGSRDAKPVFDVTFSIH